MPKISILLQIPDVLKWVNIASLEGYSVLIRFGIGVVSGIIWVQHFHSFFLAVSVRPNPNGIRTEPSPNFYPDTRWNPLRILPAFPEPSPTRHRHVPTSTPIICRSGFFQAGTKEPTPTNSESELDLDKRPTIPIPLRHQTASTPNVPETSPNYSVSCRFGFGLAVWLLH